MNRQVSAPVGLLLALSLSLLALASCATERAPATSTSTVGPLRSTGSSAGTTRSTHAPLEEPAAARARASCDDGEPTGCHAAALDAYNHAPSPQTDADAARYFTRGCEAEYAPSCNGLGVLHQQGRGVALDLEEAARLFRAACEAGASTACLHLATALRDGRGVEVDEEAAARAHARHECAFEASLGRVALEACPSL